MLTELQSRKLTRYFNVYDYDQNGYIEEKDFADILDNLADLRGWKPGTPEYTALRGGLMSIWDNLEMHANADGDGRCTLPEFLQMEERTLASEELYQMYAIEVARGVCNDRHPPATGCSAAGKAGGARRYSNGGDRWR